MLRGVLSLINAMATNSAAAVVFYFMTYSFLGWLLENSYSFITVKKFFKDGFFWGPFKPMYGFAPILLVYLIKPDSHWITIVLFCFLVPTLIEYVSGFLLQTFFKRQWWDYSHMPVQLHGHICLSFSICWIFLSIVCVKWIHPAIVSIYELISPYWIWLSPFVLVYFLSELMMAIRRHLPERRPTLEKQPKLLQ